MKKIYDYIHSNMHIIATAKTPRPHVNTVLTPEKRFNLTKKIKEPVFKLSDLKLSSPSTQQQPVSRNRDFMTI